MRLSKSFLSFLLLAFSLLTINISYAAEDPVNMLQSVANQMIAGLKANKATLKTKPAIVIGLARRYVVPHADIAAMSQRVLPPEVWRNATPSERARFQQEFTLTLIRTYASALSSYEDQSIRFFPVRGGITGNTVQVSSQIVSSNSSPINVTYTLIRSGGQWKLIDLSVEGVAMLDSFRAQFSDILSSSQKGDMMPNLLRRMSAHNNR